ncbi:MAG: hypothetical protein MUO34_04530 [Ignavibacteriaceae bacterium]|nr:hypothetical protein [Ignavibacteriaceae bacterium]
MKNLLFALVLVYLASSLSLAQFTEYPRPDEGVLTGGVGLIWIDGEPHYRISFRPEVSFANFGIGLDLNLDFDSEGKLREENFNEFSDYLSLIRYARYGLKNEPVYIKLGALDYHTLGHGTIMSQYNNSPSFDSRKIGLVMDIDFGQFGFESIYGTFGEGGIFGLRGYIRPLQFSTSTDLPILRNIEVGATYAVDFNKYAGVLGGNYNPVIDEFDITDDNGALSIIWIDIGFPVIKSSLATLTLYADYNKIINFGSGVATGVKFDLNGLGLFSAMAKLERRFNGDNYIPSYFNSFYELERFRVDPSTGLFSSKIQQLALSADIGDGWFGELGIRVLNLFDIIGSYQRLDKDSKSGILHLFTEIAPEEAPFVARAGYDKVRIQNEKDIFTLDDRAYLYTELGYKPMPYLLVSMVYHWTFTPVRDANDNVISYETQKRIEPRISFIYPFQF